MEKTYVVVVQVDQLNVWRQTSKAMLFFSEWSNRIEALREAENIAYDKRREKLHAEKDELKRMNVDYYDPRMVKVSGEIMSISRFHGTAYYLFREKLNIKRLHDIARWATAPFNVEEKDVHLLSGIESGETLRRWEESIRREEANLGILTGTAAATIG